MRNSDLGRLLPPNPNSAFRNPKSLVRHRIDDDVDSKTVGKSGILLRILRMIHPFPRVAQVTVVGHDGIETTVFIKDAEHIRNVPVGLMRRSAANAVIDVWNLKNLVNVEEHVE